MMSILLWSVKGRIGNLYNVGRKFFKSTYRYIGMPISVLDMSLQVGLSGGLIGNNSLMT